jgi:hypothetical protein
LPSSESAHAEIVFADTIRGWRAASLRAQIARVVDQASVAVPRCFAPFVCVVSEPDWSVCRRAQRSFSILGYKYGTCGAYGSIGGLLVLLAVTAALSGIAQLRRSLPPPPDPRRHAKAAARIVAAQSIGTLTASGRALANRPVVSAAVGLVSVGLVGWTMASRRKIGKAALPGKE